MTATLLAHVGHWTTTIAFVGPVVLLPLGLYAIVLIERRRGDEEGGPSA